MSWIVHNVKCFTDKFSRYLIFFSTSEMNRGGLNDLSEFLKNLFFLIDCIEYNLTSWQSIWTYTSNKIIWNI